MTGGWTNPMRRLTIVSQNSWYPGRDVTLGQPQYKTGALPNLTQLHYHFLLSHVSDTYYTSTIPVVFCFYNFISTDPSEMMDEDFTVLSETSNWTHLKLLLLHLFCVHDILQGKTQTRKEL